MLLPTGGWSCWVGPATTLAQAAGAPAGAAGRPSALSGLPWGVAILLCVLVVGGALGFLLLVRRWMKAQFEGSGEELSAESLRSLRDRNLISPEEYDRLRKAIAQRELARFNKPPPRS